MNPHHPTGESAGEPVGSGRQAAGSQAWGPVSDLYVESSPPLGWQATAMSLTRMKL